MKGILLCWLGLGCFVTLCAQDDRDLVGLSDPEGSPPIDSSALEVDYRLGFQDMLFRDQPNLAAFHLRNAGNTPIKGQLQVEQVTPIPGRAPFRHTLAARHLELGQGSRRTVILDFPPIHGEPAAALRFVDDSGNTLWQRYHHCLTPSEIRDTRLRLWTVLPPDAHFELGPLPAQPGVRLRGGAPKGFGPRRVHQAAMPLWALPEDPILLATFDGILLGQTALDRLARGQEAALAHFVARGGVLLLPDGAAAFEERCWSALPFPAPAPSRRQVNVGLGTLLRYSIAALRVPDRAANDWIYNVLASTPNRFSPSIRPPDYPSYGRRRVGNRYPSEGSRAQLSKGICLLTAAIFTLLTGPVAWLFRRTTRKRFLWMLGTTVAVFCLVATGLGLALQRATGEMWWSTLTEIPHEGGAFQTAVLELESAGAQGHALALTDPAVHFRLPNNREEWLRVPGGTQEVPLIPWARTFLIAEGYAPAAKPIECRLELLAPGAGRFSWKNPNSFEIEAVQILLVSTEGVALRMRLHRRRPNAKRDHPATLYGEAAVGPGASSVTMELSLTHTDDLMFFPQHAAVDDPIRGERVRGLRHAGFSEPVAPGSKIQAWVVFRIDRSPSLEYAADRSDFAVSGTRHYVLQRLPESALPPFDAVFRKFPTAQRANRAPR